MHERATLIAKEMLADWKDEGVIPYPGLEDALVGIAIQCNTPIAIYDRDKAIELIMTTNEWDLDESIEWFEYNVIGAYHGRNTPAFLVARPGDLDT